MRNGIGQWRSATALAGVMMAMAVVSVSGCGAGVRVVGATSGSATVSAPTSGGSSSGPVHSVDDHGLRLSVPTGWVQRDRTGSVVQEYLASIVVWRSGGSGQIPADVLLVHEADTAPRPGTDVSEQRQRSVIDQGLQSYVADPSLMQQFAASRGHGCLSGFQPVQAATRWDQAGFVGLQLEWTCMSEVAVHGWAMTAFDPAGVKHRVTITAPATQWDAHREEIDAVRRSLTATATAPPAGG